MTSEQLYGWQVALELKLRRVSGVAFQDFFADVMTRSHGDDFVPTLETLSPETAINWSAVPVKPVLSDREDGGLFGFRFD